MGKGAGSRRGGRVASPKPAVSYEPPRPSKVTGSPRMWGATGTARGHVLMARRGRLSPPLAPICTPTSRDTLLGFDHQPCPALPSGLGASGPFFPDLFTAQEASPPTSSFFSSVRVAFSFQFGSSTLSFLETPLVSLQIRSAGRAVLLEHTQQTGFVLWVRASEGSLQPARPLTALLRGLGPPWARVWTAVCPPAGLGNHSQGVESSRTKGAHVVSPRHLES